MRENDLIFTRKVDVIMPDLLAFVRRQFDNTVCICGFRAAGYTDMECTRCEAAKLIARAEIPNAD